MNICRDCRKPVFQNRARCTDCLAKATDRSKNRHHRLKAQKLCAYCGLRPADNGTSCSLCREQRNEAYRARYADRSKRGVCIDCEGAIDTNTKFCSNCLIKRRHENKRQQEKGTKHTAKVRDGFRCQICNGTKNLCVHHIDGHGERDPITRKRRKGNGDLSNLITLCRGCHASLTRFINSDNPQLAIDLILKQIARQAPEP